MTLLLIVLSSAVILTIAYLTYGPVLSRLLKLDPKAVTPAVELRDDVDYEPIEPKFLLSQHFSAIAAAGPIVGPILAGVMFGWVPALIWILVGSIFIGGVHDMTALTASIRHKARSIADVVREHMSHLSYLLFLSFVWIALVYIIVAFTDVTAQSFIGEQTLENGEVVSGGSVATSSLLYLALPIIMGLLLRYTRLSLNWATVVFVPLVGLSIFAGPFMPFSLEKIFTISSDQAHKAWDVALLVYCLIAAVVPMWLLLQPRGHLGGYFLYIALGGGMLGLLLGSAKGSVDVQYPHFMGWVTESGNPLVPILFITIACGACSGFHSIIASGTTSKQLRKETDAKPIGYGAMLLEAMVAVMSLACVMILRPDDPARNQSPNLIYGLGMGNFLQTLRIPPAFAVSFALMAFTTFVYDTLDVCTRLGRYIIQELTGWKDAKGRWLGTALTAGVPLIFVMQTAKDASGKDIPVWKAFWALFGASNQLLAALTLLGVTVWLWRTRRAWWVWLVTGIPTVFMYTMSTWALLGMTLPKFFKDDTFTAPKDPVPWIGLVLVSLAAVMLVEAIRVLLGTGTSRPNQPAPAMIATPAAGG